MDKRTDRDDKQTNRREEPGVVAHSCQPRVERMSRKFGLIFRRSSSYRVSTHLKKLRSRSPSLSSPPSAVGSGLW